MFRFLYPEKLRSRIMLLAIFLVCLPTFSIAWLVEREGFALLVQEKEQKLMAMARALEIRLDDTFGRIEAPLSREAQIRTFHARLTPALERQLVDSPRIGAGYYHKGLDAIIVYAPDDKHGNKVGLSIPADHPGRRVMTSGKAEIWMGPQVRGDIMNAMVPIIRHGEVRGYAWTNELVEDIHAQAKGLDARIILICLMGLTVSALATWILSRCLNHDIDSIKEGLARLPLDLSARLPALRGEMNEIVEGVNHLAAELGESRSINEMILDSAVDGVITVDNNGIITMLNPAAEKIVGHSYDKLVGKPYDTILDDKNYQSLLLDTLYHGNNHVGIELDFPVSGRNVHISLSTSHLKNNHDEIIGAVVIFKDLSEQQEMQRVIQQTERLVAIGELMAGVAHEIRNPLTTIRGFVQYLQKNGLSSEEKDEYLAIILKEVDSINEVIRQLLDLSKPHKNYFYPASLAQVIKDTLVLVHTYRYSPLISFNLELDESLSPLYLDNAMIKQMLLNLIINAIQAIEDRGSVTIRTFAAAGNRQGIEIRDSGSGISDDIKHLIFTPFFTTKTSGTGLGLAIVEKIIASHRGSIRIDNHKDGGAVVTIHLPVT